MPQCIARSTRSGEQCRKPAVKGATVCNTHGGSAPQVKRAAAARTLRNNALAEAERMVARAGVDIDPIVHLLDSLHVANALMNVWGLMVAQLDATAADEAEAQDRIRGELGYDTVENSRGHTDVVVTPNDRLLAVNSRGESQVHPFVREYELAVDRRAKFAKMAIDAGVEQQQVELFERQVDLAQRAFEAVLDELGLASDQKQEARRGYARHLRAVSS